MNTLPLVALKSASKSYKRGREVIDALRDVSLEIWAGEFVHFAGPSGSGKTTLLNLIAALDRPDTGSIVVAGDDISRLSLAAAAQFRSERVGIVFQSYNLLPQLTALENVLLPMIPKRRADPGRARELLNAVGLDARIHHRPPELSGGEQQRVAIARALANDPVLVLADEPTGNLDETNARDAIALLLRLCREREKTVLLVTHDLDAKRSADRTFELQAGVLMKAHDHPAT
jgi:putative ABC transport system ATP-binding protein